MNLEPYLTPYTNINLKVDTWAESIKLLEENLGVNFHVLEFENGFLDVTLKK